MPPAPCAVPLLSSASLKLSYTPRLSPTLTSPIRRTWVPLMMLMLPMRLTPSNIAAADAVANAVLLRCKTCNRQYYTVCQHATGCVATFCEELMHAHAAHGYERVGTRGQVERSNSGRQGVRACLQSLHAQCCAAPARRAAACGIDELEYGNPLDRRIIITHI
eukprot:5445468-Pleurochrysis_carterae.AAC.2